KALDLARLNAKMLGATIHFKQSNLLKNWDEQFDVIVANLPYLAEKTMTTKFEPKLALVARNKGLQIIESLIAQIHNLKVRPQFIFMEVGHDQKLAIKNLAERFLPEYNLKISKDLFGFVRFAQFSPRFS